MAVREAVPSGKEISLRCVEAASRCFAGQGRTADDATVLVKVATEFERFVRNGMSGKP